MPNNSIQTSLDVVSSPAAIKFRLLVAERIVSFTWPVALFVVAARWPALVSRESWFLLVVGLGLPLGILGWYVRSRVQRIPEPLAREDRRLYAGATVVGYSVWIFGVFYAAVALGDRGVWALSLLLIAVLGVFCYASVRADLGREPNIAPTHENI